MYFGARQWMRGKKEGRRESERVAGKKTSADRENLGLEDTLASRSVCPVHSECDRVPPVSVLIIVL